MENVLRQLYRRNELKGHRTVYVVEGEKCAGRMWDAGFPATTCVGGAGNWTTKNPIADGSYAAQLRIGGTVEVVFLPDNDGPGRRHGEDVGQSCQAEGLTVRYANLPGLPKKGDVVDWLKTHSVDELKQLLKDARLFRPSAVKDLPDKEKRPAKKQGKGLELENPEPAEASVDGPAMLDGVMALLTRFIVMSREASVAVTLWIVHTYLMEVWWLSAILTVNSPTKRCGKTNLLKLVATLSSRSLPASNISPAALFRTIERYQPTLLLDAAETFLKDNEDLRGIINAGHTRSQAHS